MCLEGPLAYFSATVWAEMKKSVAYRTDFSLKDGVIHESQCECGAGQGPSAHCKHVGATIYGVNRFATDGYVLTEQTCTQVREIR